MGLWQILAAMARTAGLCSVAENISVCSRAAPSPPAGSFRNSFRMPSCVRGPHRRLPASERRPEGGGWCIRAETDEAGVVYDVCLRN